MTTNEQASESLTELAQRFDGARRHLRSVAYGLLGSAADAEDAVQSAWLKASRSTPHDVENLTGWFTTITAREALDQLRARKRRSEQPLGDIGEAASMVSAGADEDLLLAESLSRALLVVIDRLSPPERVAFVLHDVFAVPFETIADVLNRSPVAAKKLASRARARLHQRPETQSPRTADHVKIVEAFLAASRGGDIDALLQLLAPDVVRRVDLAVIPAQQRAGVAAELRGARRIAEETRLFSHRARVGVVLLVDGVPTVVIAPAGRAAAILRLRIGDDGRIHQIDITGDVESLRNGVLALPFSALDGRSQEDHRAMD